MNDLPSPASLSFVGAVSVLVVYWLHLALLGLPLANETGVSITILVSAFLAQYIPLRLLKMES